MEPDVVRWIAAVNVGKTPISKLQPYCSEDLPRYVALLQACEAEDQTGRTSSIEGMSHMFSMPGVNIERGIWLLPESAEENAPLLAAGFMLLLPMYVSDALAIHVSVRPDWRHKGVEQGLIKFLESQAQENIYVPHPVKVYALAEGQGDYQHRLYAEAAYQPVRWFQTLHRDLNLSQKEAHGLGVEAPTGLHIRPLQTDTLEQDIEDLHLALTEAFLDHWNPTEMTLEQTRHMVMAPHFRPDLTLLAYDENGEVAGACRNVIRTNYNLQMGTREGAIDELGVRRPYRRHGLGRALLQRSFQLLKEVGMDTVTLMVDSQNLTGATRLYEAVGFVERRRSAIYEKTLAEV